MDNALRMTGLALRAGRLEVGEDPVGEACRRRACRLLLTARDAAEGSLRRAGYFAEEGQCLLLAAPWSKEELGAALGRSSCAMAAVTDLGFAQSIAGKLAEADPAAYGPAVERLERKAERAAQRKKNKRGKVSPKWK